LNRQPEHRALELQSGPRSSIAGQDNTLANLNYSAETGIGNAKCECRLGAADRRRERVQSLGLAGENREQRRRMVGDNIFGSFGGGGGVAGTSGPASVGGAPLSDSNSSDLFGLLGSVFSDERLKGDIEPVGKLYDGQESTNITTSARRYGRSA
jgi:hypothetical protein